MSSFPLVTLNVDGHISFTEENCYQLKTELGASSHVRPVLIFGNMRAGKSYLASLFSGDANVFTSRNGHLSVTQGIDFCTKISVESLRGQPPPYDQVEKVMVMDVEGQGERGENFDIKLLLPALLCSSVAILVCASCGDVAKSRFWNQLQVITHYANELGQSTQLSSSRTLLVVVNAFEGDAAAARRDWSAMVADKKFEPIRRVFSQILFHPMPKVARVDENGIVGANTVHTFGGLALSKEYCDEYKKLVENIIAGTNAPQTFDALEIAPATLPQILSDLYAMVYKDDFNVLSTFDAILKALVDPVREKAKDDLANKLATLLVKSKNEIAAIEAEVDKAGGVMPVTTVRTKLDSIVEILYQERDEINKQVRDSLEAALRYLPQNERNRELERYATHYKTEETNFQTQVITTRDLCLKSAESRELKETLRQQQQQAQQKQNELDKMKKNNADLDARLREKEKREVEERRRQQMEQSENQLIGGVRVEIGHYDYLSLTEVQLFTKTEVNIALKTKGSTATQSTNYTAGAGEAWRAINGVADGNFANGHVTHTAASFDEFWEVTLGKPQKLADLSRIVVWNRTDCCGERLYGARIKLLRKDRSVARDFTFGNGFSNVETFRL